MFISFHCCKNDFDVDFLNHDREIVYLQKNCETFKQTHVRIDCMFFAIFQIFVFVYWFVCKIDLMFRFRSNDESMKWNENFLKISTKNFDTKNCIKFSIKSKMWKIFEFLKSCKDNKQIQNTISFFIQIIFIFLIENLIHFINTFNRINLSTHSCRRRARSKRQHISNWKIVYFFVIVNNFIRSIWFK